MRHPPHLARMVAVLAVCFLAMGGSLAATRVFDDFHSVFDNPAVQEPGNIGRFFLDSSAFSVYQTRSYRPITLASYAVTFALFGDWLPAFHAGNLLFHLACVAALYLFYLALFRAAGDARPENGASIAALVFAIHPGVGQVVHYISSRSESLAFFGTSAALACHAWSLSPTTSAVRRRALCAGTAASVGFALCSKEAGILAVPLLVAVDLALAPDWRRDAFARLLRLAVPLGVVAVYFTIQLLPGLFIAPSSVAPIAAALPGRSDWMTDSLRALWVYLQISVFPGQLAMWRELPPSTAPALSAAFAAAGLVGGLAASLALMLRPKTKLFGLAGILYLVPFVPYLFRPLRLVVNENRMYPPLAGLALAVAALYVGPLARWAAPSRTRRRVVAALGVCLVSLAVLRDWRTSATWLSETEIWSNAVAVSPFSGDIRAGLGTAYMRQERWQEGLEQFVAASRLPASQIDAIYDNLAIASYELGRTEDAHKYLLQAYAANPRSPEVLRNLGALLREQGRPEEALGHLQRSIELSPGYCDARFELMDTLHDLGRPAAVAAALRELPRPCLASPRAAEIGRRIRGGPPPARHRP